MSRRRFFGRLMASCATWWAPAPAFQAHSDWITYTVPVVADFGSFKKKTAIKEWLANLETKHNERAQEILTTQLFS